MGISLAYDFGYSLSLVVFFHIHMCPYNMERWLKHSHDHRIRTSTININKMNLINKQPPRSSFLMRKELPHRNKTGPGKRPNRKQLSSRRKSDIKLLHHCLLSLHPPPPSSTILPPPPFPLLQVRIQPSKLLCLWGHNPLSKKEGPTEA